MPIYGNSNAHSPIAGVEFIPKPEGNLTFFFVRSSEDMDKAKEQLKNMGQEVVAESLVQHTPVLVTKGSSSEAEIKSKLAAQGDRLSTPHPVYHFDAWKWRGRLSDIGQGLTLLSAKMSGKEIDGPKMMFAGINLFTNWINKTFGAEEMTDPHHLRYLKEHLGAIYAPALSEGVELPPVSKQLREVPEKKMTFVEKCASFIRKNSVRAGEIGLRLLGSIVMVLSIDQFKRMGQQKETEQKLINGVMKDVPKYIKGTFKLDRVWETMKTKPAGTVWGLLNEDKTNRNVGYIYVVGKMIGLLFAKAPDPYDPKPKTFGDEVRENYVFPAETVLQMVAGYTLAKGSYDKKFRGKSGANGPIKQRDYIGTAGGLALTSGLGVRAIAPFGVRRVDQKELNAYIVDSIALAPPEKRPELLAQTVAYLKDHFKEDPETYAKNGLESFGQMYIKLKDQLYHDRGISLYSNAASPIIEPTKKFAEKLPVPAAEAGYAEKLRQQPQQNAIGIS